VRNTMRNPQTDRVKPTARPRMNEQIPERTHGLVQKQTKLQLLPIVSWLTWHLTPPSFLWYKPRT
jgi:hypothetical protein